MAVVEEVAPSIDPFLNARSRRRRKRMKERADKRIKALKVKPSASDGISPRVSKYWFHRYSLFSRYDQGIKMDEEGWFSVTPEEVAVKHAQSCVGGTIIDCFTGVGGNAIQFARMCYHVVAIDIDPRKVEMAFNNAKVYGVEDNIDFIVGDFFQLAPFLKGDVIFLSPPWGGPAYSAIDNFTLDLLKPKDGLKRIMWEVISRALLLILGALLGHLHDLNCATSKFSAVNEVFCCYGKLLEWDRAAKKRYRCVLIYEQAHWHWHV